MYREKLANPFVLITSSILVGIFAALIFTLFNFREQSANLERYYKDVAVEERSPLFCSKTGNEGYCYRVSGFDVTYYFTDLVYFQYWTKYLRFIYPSFVLFSFLILSYAIQVLRKIFSSYRFRLLSIFGVISLFLLIPAAMLEGGHPPAIFLVAPPALLFGFIGALMVWFPKKKEVAFEV